MAARSQLEQMRALPPGSLVGQPVPGGPADEAHEQGSQGGMYL